MGEAVNDKLGHPAGDRALQQVARVIIDHTRCTDLISRIGGDEFAILILNARSAESTKVCLQIVDAISNQMTDDGLGITASVGCVSCEVPPESSTEAIHLADEAMFIAKREAKGSLVPRSYLAGTGIPLSPASPDPS